ALFTSAVPLPEMQSHRKDIRRRRGAENDGKSRVGSFRCAFLPLRTLHLCGATPGNAKPPQRHQKTERSGERWKIPRWKFPVRLSSSAHSSPLRCHSRKCKATAETSEDGEERRTMENPALEVSGA